MKTAPGGDRWTPAERVALARRVLAKIVTAASGEEAASFTVEETEFIAFAIVNHIGLQAVA